MARFFQFISYPFIWGFARLFLSVEFKNADGLKKAPKGPLIIVANHVAVYDSFLIRLVTGWNNLPIRFMGVTKFDIPFLQRLWKIGVIPLAYYLFGVFEIVIGRGLDRNLDTPRRILGEGGVILIYPEGSINRTNALMPFKRGATVLAATTGTPILPLSFCEVNEPGKRVRVIISVGSPMRVSPGQDYDAFTRELEHAVSGLCEYEPVSYPAAELAPEAVAS
jgi:1-acyl-sn-glycerol-3-phosphate acyltransferase